VRPEMLVPFTDFQKGLHAARLKRSAEQYYIAKYGEAVSTVIKSLHEDVEEVEIAHAIGEGLGLINDY